MFLSLFGSFSQLAQTPSVVALQDPLVYRGKLSSFQFYSCFSPLSIGTKKPRVVFYVFSFFLSTISLLPRFFDRGDIIALDLFTPDGFFNPSMTRFTINSYSSKGRSNNTRSLPPDLIFPYLPGLKLTLSDLNIHHPTDDPMRNFKEDELATFVPYFDRATELGFSLLNTAGVYTRFSMSLVSRPGVLDLAFACPLVAPYPSEWSDPLPSTGSDHIPILLPFDAPLFRAPPPKPNWGMTDWPQVDKALKSIKIPPPPPLPTSHALGVWFDTNLNKISATLALHTPQVRHPQVQGVVHHNSLGTSKGLQLHSLGVQGRTPPFLSSDVGQSRPVLVLQGNKEGKKESLVPALVEGYPPDSLDSKEICHSPPPRFPELPGASTPLELNVALLDHNFLRSPVTAPQTILLPFWDVLALEASEIDRVLACSSRSSAPAPDKTPNSV